MTNHQEIVRKVLDAKAIDFEAIGKIIAEVGPTRALAEEPWEEFCGTMRYFIRFNILSKFQQESHILDKENPFQHGGPETELSR